MWQNDGTRWHHSDRSKMNIVMGQRVFGMLVGVGEVSGENDEGRGHK